ncbi:MAG: amino acid deaminase [Rhodoglobus sp.]
MSDTVRIADDAARQARTDPHSALDDYPWLGDAIDQDVSAERLELWGRSTVIDENTGSAVLSPELFAAIHARAGIQAHWPIGNAGLLHVYGYLLSQAPTPYGLKRARWLDGALARAYGLADDAFVPWVGPGTLLERVSQAAGELLTSTAAHTSDVSGITTSMALGRIPGEGPWALAYAVGGLLVTTFPVASADAVIAEWDAAPARLRWNAAE